MVLSEVRFIGQRLAVILLSSSLTLIFAAGSPRSALAAVAQERIDINTATIEDLRGLPSIGEVLARRIVDYRRRHGDFRRPQDLILVRGISVGLYRRIANSIKVSESGQRR